MTSENQGGKNQVKDILVLGGTRYFGRSIVEEFVAAGHRVTVFTRGNRRPELLRHVTHVKGDRRDFPSFRELFRGKVFDAVIDNIGYLPDEVETTLDVFQGNAGLYIYTSSISAYQDRYLDCESLREDDFRAAPGSISSIHNVADYCLGKNQCESRVAQNKDLPYVILRPPLVIGPDDHALNLYFFLQRMLDGGPIILPKLSKHNLRHIYEKDLARVYPRLVDQTSCWNGAFNIAGKEVLTAEEYLGYIANHVDKELRIVYLPQAELDAKDYVQPFEFNRISDISRLQEEVGVELTTFGTWMSTTVDWYLTDYTGPDSKGYERRQEEIDLAAQQRR